MSATNDDETPTEPEFELYGHARHWLTRYDPEDGEPYGTGCECQIGVNHNGYGELTGP